MNMDIFLTFLWILLSEKPCICH